MSRRKLMRDADIRRALRNFLESRHCQDPDTFIVEELGLCEGEARVDVAVINGILAGYEIKSPKDTLERLSGQETIYSKALNEVTVVTAGSHVDRIAKMVPSWWGIITVEQGGRLSTIRSARSNPNPDTYYLAQLLWRNELVEELQRLGVPKSRLRDPRRILWHRIATLLSSNELIEVVRRRIKGRENWRSVRSSSLSGGQFRPFSTS